MPQAPLRANTDPSFVGIDALKARHAEQLALFRTWARAGEWDEFHRAHYDWWMFPIDKPSSYGKAWTVYASEVAALKGDSAYIANYLEGAALLAASWGWDLERRAPLPNPAPAQRWQRWPIRLHKAASSLRLFGFDDHFASLRQYARLLIERGESFQYNGRDLSELFVAPEPR